MDQIVRMSATVRRRSAYSSHMRITALGGGEVNALQSIARLRVRRGVNHRASASCSLHHPNQGVASYELKSCRPVI